MILYSTNCPKCFMLERALTKKGVEYTVETNVGKMIALGITSVPVLELDDGTRLTYEKAMQAYL